MAKPSPKDTLEVVAYRMGEAETAIREGFLTMHKKLDDMNNHFVSREELKSLEEQSSKLHDDHENRLRRLEESVFSNLGGLNAIKVAFLILAALIGALWWAR